MTWKFLSTPPSRVATPRTDAGRPQVAGFYPRHPRGWRPELDAGIVRLKFVSIHATLAGGDVSLMV